MILLAGVAGGCANYEFDLIRPDQFHAHVGTKDVAFTRAPLQYRLNAVEGRLVMRIYNPTENPIQLLGELSTVVDPQGQSHPLRGGVIAPDSFIKLILPPLGPDLERSGPSIGLGFGVVAGSDRHWATDDSFSDQSLLLSEAPRYMYVVEDRDLFWKWDGETDVRLSLVLARGDERFTQDFVLHRVKV
jgi:hypothetical protein